MQRFSTTLVAFVTDLETGKPLEGVKISLVDSQIEPLVTNSEGIAIMENTDLSLVHVIATMEGVKTMPEWSLTVFRIARILL